MGTTPQSGKPRTLRIVELLRIVESIHKKMGALGDDHRRRCRLQAAQLDLLQRVKRLEEGR